MPNEEMGRRTLPEPPEVASAIVFAATGGFLVFVTLMMVAVYFYLRIGAPDALRPIVEHPFPQPALQKAPQNDLQQYEAEQRAALSGYSWVDQAQGIARIPIADAMRIVVKRGAHAYDPPEQAAPLDTPTPPQGARP